MVHHNLPIKIFLFNNSGYLSIRQTQEGFLNSNYVGSHASGGISMPDYQKVCAAYGVHSVRVSSHKNLRESIRAILDAPGPAVCEAMIHEHQELVPRMGFRKHADGTASGMPLEDMAPFLGREEFKKLMVVSPLTESLKE
jgi:acetolactate synthase-1/2/3 large subunit